MKSGPYQRTLPIYFTYQPAKVTRWYSYDPTRTVIIANSQLPVYAWKTVNGVYNANWKQNRGKVAINSAYSLDLQLQEVKIGEPSVGTKTGITYDTWGRPVYYTEYHEAWGFPYPTNSGQSGLNAVISLSKADNRAKLDLFRKITNEYRKFSGGTVMWEIRETLSMIRKPGKALWAGVEKYLTEVPKRVKRGQSPLSTYRSISARERAIKAQHRVLRETWLEMSYGWAPLLGDIRDIAGAAAEMCADVAREYEGIRSIRSKRVAADSTRSVATVSRLYDNSFGWQLKYNEVATRDESAWVMYTAQCDRKVLYPQNELQKLVQLSGFSLREWVPTLWNCIPYSFLVDYFTNVGDVVEFYATDRSSIVGLTKSVRQDITHRIVNTLDKSDPATASYKWSGSDLGSLKSSRTLFNRTLVDPVLLDVRFELENPLPSPKKLFNMAALAGQFYGAKLSLAR